MKKGEKVNFLDSVGGGKIIQINADHALVWVETEDGFDVGPIPMSQVVPVSGMNDYNSRVSRRTPGQQIVHTLAPIRGAQAMAEREENEIAFPQKRSQSQRGEYILDLHMSALPTAGNGMSAAEKHQYQLQYFRLQMSQNIRYRGRRIVVIHGRGDGTLKNEIRNILKHEYGSKVEYHDADFSRFEDGATLVIIK